MLQKSFVSQQLLLIWSGYISWSLERWIDDLHLLNNLPDQLMKQWAYPDWSRACLAVTHCDWLKHIRKTKVQILQGESVICPDKSKHTVFMLWPQVGLAVPGPVLHTHHQNITPLWELILYAVIWSLIDFQSFPHWFSFSSLIFGRSSGLF